MEQYVEGNHKINAKFIIFCLYFYIYNTKKSG